ncbi:MAG: M48 family metalloprotease [Fibromonadaceae bacterium]|jgi:hypothetical protein|nr:M48 family metalloprotease [Fibromonadaceae bacterium]
MSNKWKFFWVASLSLVIFFQACGVVHSWEEFIVSTTDEKKMGREFDSLVWIKHGDVVKSGEEIFVPNTPEEQALYEYYQARGREMVNLIDKKDMDGILTSEKLCRNDITNKNQAVSCKKENFFEFKIIKSETKNAFAVPGGYVYFYTKILKPTSSNTNSGFKSESELMSVMGHEIGHVVLHHSRDRIVKQVGAATIINLLLGDGMGAVLANLGASFWLLSNSREDESQSDSMGFYYTSKMGISSKGLSDFFERGLKKNSAGQCDKAENASAGDVFSTHPPSCERVLANDDKIIRYGTQNLPMDLHTSPKPFKELVCDAFNIVPCP